MPEGKLSLPTLCNEAHSQLTSITHVEPDLRTCQLICLSLLSKSAKGVSFAVFCGALDLWMKRHKNEAETPKDPKIGPSQNW